MILAKSEAVFCNGVKDPDIFANNVHVWPGRGELNFFRVYITWDPAKNENLTFQGLGWNGNPGSLTSDMILDAHKKNTSYSYTNMTTSELDGILDTSTGTGIYCYGIAVDIDSTAFSNFQWRTQQHYATTGTVEIKVDAYYENGIVSRAKKTVTQAANTTFTIVDGEFDT